MKTFDPITLEDGDSLVVRTDDFETTLTLSEGPIDSKATDIEELDLSVATYNCLKKNGIFTVADLLDANPYELLGTVRGFGKACLKDAKDKLSKLGFRWADNEEDFTWKVGRLTIEHRPIFR